ncbi:MULTISPECIES: hypothetical protein [Acinetobacter calcoaceticus/baumannii complex]|uniref:hypothetical protein n=1 Tax=Acinetobacter calcoaceticus/baumannii complex TaxID=909768 RepID=UPI00021B7B5F|nr:MULTISPECIES: hypothetical protein [Acinetobacter calcoaceticus/baumannii complex]KCY93842.1 hypothetical protein J729_0827 [Acinetobacter baumannii 929679-598]EGT97413.1 hypothetical protein ABNIH3_10738 [Acinetobacter baumannii ABNIH3]EHU1215830.1 hypothetical protein [Acinetobacter baumannii]EHU2778256.1 hypothetical protein [Acinetobacter baumannii]EYS55615.1 hypothetical protein K006_0904 [Acinetobacter baumannii 16553_10]
MKKIELNIISGTSDQIATEVFQKIIEPMVDEMNSQDKDSAKIFTFSVMWLGMALYAAQFEPDNAKKTIQFSVDQFIATLDKFNKRLS